MKPGLRILICRLSAHGDVIQTLPLLHALKTDLPGCFVGWLVDYRAADLLKGHPDLDNLHVLDDHVLRDALSQPTQLRRAWQLLRQLRSDIQAQQYDVSLDVQGLLKSAFWPYWAGIPQRVGFKRTREFAAWFYTALLQPHDLLNPHLRTVDIFADMASALTGQPRSRPATYQLAPILPSASAVVSHWLSCVSPALPIIALAPGTAWSTKRWPHWPVLFQALQDRTVILIGGPGDRAYVQMLLEAAFGMPQSLPSTWQNRVGQTDWPRLHALLSRVDVLVGLDSVALHLADAVGHARLVALFGPTASGRTGPIGPAAHHVLTTTHLACQPCFARECPLGTHACMVELPPEVVLHAIEACL